MTTQISPKCDKSVHPYMQYLHFPELQDMDTYIKMLFILRCIVNNKKVVSLPIPPSTHQLVCAEAPCAISCFVFCF